MHRHFHHHLRRKAGHASLPLPLVHVFLLFVFLLFFLLFPLTSGGIKGFLFFSFIHFSGEAEGLVVQPAIEAVGEDLLRRVVVEPRGRFVSVLP